jgi:predicted dehydrogenase
VPWSIKALEAGKHVLCEKPIGLTTAEAQLLLEEARKRPRLKVMEAFMYRHHPQWQLARNLVAEGKIGVLQTIQSFFSYYKTDSGNIRNIAEFGGGGLMDIGCYCLSLARFIFGTEPQRVWGAMDYAPEFRTDRLTSGMLDFGNGTSTFTCATQLVPYQQVNILGTEGRIEIDIPFVPPPDQPSRIRYSHGGETEEILLDICNHYSIQGDLFSLAVLNDTGVPTPLEDAVANMRVIEAVICSAEDECWVNL